MNVKLEPDRLRKYGYTDIVHTPERARRVALGVAILSEQPASIYKRLVVLRTFNKNKNPELARRLGRDIKWLHRVIYGYGH